ncbi:MAG: hypothetical protein HGB23_04155 [Chlorobiaceae bacterium]|nr:hypothetical protein [Chlorobiaceae bacterium]
MNRMMFIAIAVLFTSAKTSATTSEQYAGFDHSRLNASAQCLRCHSRDQPDDTLHRQTKAGCSSCHSTSQWKPAINKP